MEEGEDRETRIVCRGEGDGEGGGRVARGGKRKRKELWRRKGRRERQELCRED